MVFVRAYDTICGRVFIAEENLFITNIGFSPVKGENKETPLIKEAYKELCEYFAGERQKFNLPLNPNGTGFQKRVWKALLKIPYGQTTAYKDIAIAIGSEKACRAVGLANNKNPICIVIPCHRVIGSNGSLTGYAGGLDIKKKLLEIEKNNYF